MTRLTHSPIDLAELLREVSGSGLGGTALFVGSVRRGPDDGTVQAIEYSAYDEMADAELARIIQEALGRWPECRIEARHRLGTLQVGEHSIAVAAAAPHRAEAFAACRHVIEELKVRLPVWKKEIFEDGSAGWRGNDGSRGPAARA